jgi:KaiC/GvpD/RAD55 family RecA-like ATPase
MTVKELMIKVSEYEEKNYIYMNFSIDEDGMWGLPEGTISQKYMNENKINQYKEFLNDAIEHYDTMIRFDLDAKKKRDKYKKYLKRLETAINKMAA